MNISRRRPIALAALAALAIFGLGAVDASIPILSAIQTSLNSLVEAFAPPPLRMSARLTADNTRSASFTPGPGDFSLGLHMTGAPTAVHVQRAVNIGTVRLATIAGTAVTFTQGDASDVQTGMYVTGPGILEGTTYTIGADSTHGVLSQAAASGPGVPLTFWAVHESFSTSIPVNIRWMSCTSWCLYVPSGGLNGGTVLGNFVRGGSRQ